MKLSVVATLYNSAPYLAEFHRRVRDVADRISGGDFEIILVNDGSPDESLALATDLALADERLILVDLSRNFGHHRAMMTGLGHAAGDLVFLIDSDLEEDPEWLIPFHETMVAGRCDVVYGIQKYRKGGWFERWSGDIFYRMFNRVTSIGIPANSVTARLMTKRYVRSLVAHEEREIFIPGLWHITGYEQVPFAVDKHSKSGTTYTLDRKIALFVNSITSFSNAPLIFTFYLGTLLLLISVCYMSYIITRWYLYGISVTGWTTLVVSLWMLGGLNILLIGILGIYISKLYSEVKRRPYAIVRDIIRKGLRQGDGGDR